MSKIPLKVRVDLRDLWESPNAPAQKAISALTELLGYQVVVETDLSLLWHDLQKSCPDLEIFVPNITALIEEWANCLTARLEDDNNAQWTEKLLSDVESQGCVVKLRLEPCQCSRVRTSWSKSRSEFMISIPETLPLDTSSSFMLFDLEHIFALDSSVSKSASKPEDSEWDTVPMPTRDKQMASSVLPTPSRLPALISLAKPETLFPLQVPYHMILQIRQNSVSVQGSHQPSLQLMNDYFEKYARIDRNDSRKVPFLKVELQQSWFGQGTLLDSLTVTPSNFRAEWENINPTLFISFIESILGYRNVPEPSGGGQWQFRRDVPSL